MTFKTTIHLFLLLFFINSCQGNQVIQQQLKKEKEQIRLEAEKDKLRDSKKRLLQIKANQLISEKKYENGISYLDSALLYSLDFEKQEINYKRAQVFFELKEYNESIKTFNQLISSDYKTKDTYYQRALCYLKLNQNQEAVNDLKKSIELGNSEAEELHEKVNPLKKRVAYYVTRCCDGTTSDAKGRGACSHHDGVCDWNEPVYEEYRKY